MLLSIVAYLFYDDLNDIQERIKDAFLTYFNLIEIEEEQIEEEELMSELSLWEKIEILLKNLYKNLFE